MRRFESALAQLPISDSLAQSRQFVLRVRNIRWHWSKALSGLGLFVSIALLLAMHTQDQWFIYEEDVSFNRTTYVDPDAIFELADIRGWNLFWLQPESIRRRILTDPFVADAQVSILFPPRVEITIQERQPVALWITDAGTYWVVDNGAALPISRADEHQPGESLSVLPQIVDTRQEAQALSGPTKPAMDTGVLASALALTQALPELENTVRYNRSVGLNFSLPDLGIWVYWGNGQEMDSKLENLIAARQLLDNGDQAAQIVDVRFTDQPYMR